MKNAEDKLTDIQDNLPKDEDLFVTAVRFQPNLELQKLIQRKDAFGNLLNKSPSEINASFVTDINVKSSRDAEICTIKSVALLSENKLVITDLNNKSIKLMDIECKRILSEYKTENSIHDVIVVGKTRVAVTLPDAKKIQFLKSDDELSFDDEITFKAKCWYFACVENKLVVSFSNPWEVRILNMTGDVLQTFATSSQGDRLFSKAPYLCESPFNQAIYASDWQENSVTMLDMDGNVRTIYEDSVLKGPHNAAVDDIGMVYLCGTYSNNIHLLTPDCRKVKILLSGRDHGIHRPHGICYCKLTQRLYVGMSNNDTIKVFQLA